MAHWMQFRETTKFEQQLRPVLPQQLQTAPPLHPLGARGAPAAILHSNGNVSPPTHTLKHFDDYTLIKHTSYSLGPSAGQNAQRRWQRARAATYRLRARAGQTKCMRPGHICAVCRGDASPERGRVGYSVYMETGCRGIGFGKFARGAGGSRDGRGALMEGALPINRQTGRHCRCHQTYRHCHQTGHRS